MLRIALTITAAIASALPLAAASTASAVADTAPLAMSTQVIGWD
ncbi:hypothetical protein [Kitasatospora sp. NPDC090308]